MTSAELLILAFGPIGPAGLSASVRATCRLRESHWGVYDMICMVCSPGLAPPEPRGRIRGDALVWPPLLSVRETWSDSAGVIQWYFSGPRFSHLRTLISAKNVARNPGHTH